ncbi:MAG: xanthine dehydrogenase family protein molybdopterin-binding subunit [Beijerinckiaceae bacterium]|nr:xanthine dehydrogenase family protein molybdopterin-binding subunit [Beijerinckiaceae bacterium]
MTTILKKPGFNPDRKYKIIGTSPVKHDGFDKVTGRAKFAADAFLPGMLVGKVLRSPHPHAILKRIDTTQASKVPGVKAIITRDDFPEIKQGTGGGDMTRLAMAREKVYWEGHPVAAVAATSESAAKKALKLIEVEYEVLPHVIDPVEAMSPDAPILHDYMRTKGAKGPDAEKPTNVVERHALGIGDVDKGFAEADVIVEGTFDTKPMHQGYIELQSCVANYSDDGQVDLWCCTQAPWVYRDRLTEILKIESSKIRIQQSELGGGFGGKTTFYLEPLSVVLSRKAKCPVKMTLTRVEVMRATGPVSGTQSTIKMGCKKDGTIVAVDSTLVFQTGPYTGSAFTNAPQAMLTRYDLKNVRTVSYEVVSNRPKVSSFRAPCVPQVVFGVEGLIDELATKIGMDPIEMRLKNAIVEGHKTIYGETFNRIGFVETLEAAKACDHYRAPVPKGQARGIACGFWFNRGGETTGSMNLAPDGTVTITLGTADVAGSRMSMAMMAAEELGIPVDRVRAVLADTHSLGYNRVTAGSRTTFSSGIIVVDSARKIITELCRRAAKIWNVPEEGVVFEDGVCRPASSNVGEFEPLSIKDIAHKTTYTMGSISGHSEMNVTGAGPGFAVHIVDVEVDKETGLTSVKRYTIIEDAGKAISPAQVEGQFQGAAVQGIGWALNEEYVYGSDGRLQNPGFLDYRMPVASDVPMIDTVIVEVPNPKHPFGLRGVGEVPLTPAMAAIGNAIGHAIGIRPRSLPMSPPKVLAIIEEARARGVLPAG